MYKNIYIHIGLPKTGTTYLQNCLAQLSFEERLNDTDYPVMGEYVGDNYRISNGNAAELSKLLIEHVNPKFDRDKLKQYVSDFFKNKSIKSSLLISSENFSSAEPDRFNYFVELIKSFTERIFLIIVARDVDGYAYSSYNQLIKRHALAITYEDYCENYFISQFSELVARINSFQIEKICIQYSYESLLKDFLHVINESIDSYLGFDFKANRSLTENELRLLVKINEIFKSKEISTSISDCWIRLYPEEYTEIRYLNNELLKKLVNNFKNNNSELAEFIFNIKLQDKKENNTSANLCARKYEELSLLAFNVINEFFDGKNIHSYTVHLEKSKDRFDPIHYLLLNPDVLKENVDPVEHYFIHGRSENRFTSFSFVNVLIPK